MKFKRLTDNESFDLIPYLKSYLSQKKAYEVQIHVGCDSQVKLGRTTYVSTIVLHVGNNFGCHILYKKEIVPQKLDLWSKLWGEVERSVELTRF